LTVPSGNCQLFAAGWWFSTGTPVSSTNKTDRHDIQNTINQTFSIFSRMIFSKEYLFGDFSSNHIQTCIINMSLSRLKLWVLPFITRWTWYNIMWCLSRDFWQFSEFLTLCDVCQWHLAVQWISHIMWCLSV